MHSSRLSRRPTFVALSALAALFALSGCDEGSISDPNPFDRPGYVGGRTREIDELDLLGAHQGTSERDIQDALRHGGSGGVYARPGSSLLVVQSGAMAPDSIMLAAIEKVYRVFPFSGVAANDQKRDGALGRELRLAAAKSGSSYVLCYWGKVESIREDAATKGVSWVPVVGGLIPDEQRDARLRVRAMLIDVASGRTAVFNPPAVENTAISAWVTRAGSHDGQMNDLKTRAYASLVAQMSGLPN